MEKKVKTIYIGIYQERLYAGCTFKNPISGRNYDTMKFITEIFTKLEPEVIINKKNTQNKSQ